MSRSFSYTPLPDPKNYVRLLRLKPWNHETGIEGELVPLPVFENPVYHAVSYTWGPVQPTSTIWINGERFQVRQNLQRFLEHAAHRSSNPLLWIDAICIHQADNVEKGFQVQMMGSIFHKAEQVLIWLGATEPLIGEAFKFLKFAEEHFGKATVRKKFQASFGGEILRLTEALESIFLQPYWGRTWVIQEFLLAKRLVVCYGHQQMAWDALEFWSYNSDLVFSAMGEPEGSHEHFRVSRGDVDHLIMVQTQIQRGRPGENLLELASEFKYTDCFDPRDKIYAFMGLSKASMRFRVDYKKTLMQVFLDALEAQTLAQGSCHFASAVMETLQLGLPPVVDQQFIDNLSTSVFSNPSDPSERCFRVAGRIPGVITKLWPPTYSFVPKDDEECSLFIQEPLSPILRHSNLDQTIWGIAAASVKRGDRLFIPQSSHVGFILRLDNRSESPRVIGRAFFTSQYRKELGSWKVTDVDARRFTSPPTDARGYTLVHRGDGITPGDTAYDFLLTTIQMLALLSDEVYWREVEVSFLS